VREPASPPAVDCNDTVVARLSAAGNQDHGGRLRATALSWDNIEALVALAHAEATDLVLVADTVYPMKDSSPLLAALAALVAARPGLRIIAATTCRDRGVHASFEQGLKRISPGQFEHLTTDEGHADPLYGSAPVYIFALSANASKIAEVQARVQAAGPADGPVTMQG
jgi:hypothetical protein